MPEFLRNTAELVAELEHAREALWECARISGADLEGDSWRVLTHPSVEQFAIEQVGELRACYDEIILSDAWMSNSSDSGQ
jgi:hypothetical protein